MTAKTEKLWDPELGIVYRNWISDEDCYYTNDDCAADETICAMINETDLMPYDGQDGF